MRAAYKLRGEAGQSNAIVIVLVAFIILMLGGGLIYLRSTQNKTDKGEKQESKKQEDTTKSADVLLRLHGSNTIGSQLGPELAMAFFRKQGATDIQQVRKGTEEVTIKGTLPGRSAPQTIEVEAHGTGTAFKDLANGACDIGMASRPIKDDEKRATAALGDLTSPASEHVLGLDGVAIIVNRSNPVQAIDVGKLARIFAGEITDWSDIGGSAGPIKLFARDEKSGTWDSFKSKVLGDTPLSRSAERIEDSRELSNKVSALAGGIGFVGLPYVLDTKPLAVFESDQSGKPGSRGTTPLLPTTLTIRTESYRLSRRLYLYTAANSTNPAVNDFVRFANSDEGQDIVEKTGFVSQKVVIPTQPSNVQISANAPERYRRMVDGARRMELDFRFRPGSTNLDNKALADLTRVVTVLQALQHSNDRLILLGFADNTGIPSANEALSRERAKAVEQQLVMRGVQVATAEGFGQENPVASNASLAGREQNRRVEVWVK
jgi:phosphate transport system substrate-binding protein